MIYNFIREYGLLNKSKTNYLIIFAIFALSSTQRLFILSIKVFDLISPPNSPKTSPA